MAIEESLMDKVISLCSRRGIVFPTSEIYGAFGGFFDYGSVGVELKRNIVSSWWNFFVHSREDVVGMDGAIVTNPTVWKASGHVDAFKDPLVECSKCKTRYRADHLIEQELKLSVDGMSSEKLGELIKENKIKCGKCGGLLESVAPFSLMFKTFVGSVENSASEAFLRPETAQLIFTNFKAIMLSSRQKLPFGIAQVGKSFRNEISPRNFVFRAREFEQMEIEFFIHPKKLDECFIPKEELALVFRLCTQEMQEEGKSSEVIELSLQQLIEEKVVKTRWHAYWLSQCMKWLQSIGLSKEKLRLRQHRKEELSHYSCETWDIEYNYPSWGWKELMGIANRGDFDLTQHSKFSGKDLSVFDEETREKIVPHVIEPSWGLDRLLFTLLLDAYSEKKEKEETKIILKLEPQIAPLKIGVFPLMKKDGLAEKAREVYFLLRNQFTCFYDESGSIGKRYARADEIGVPYCITIDYESLEKNDVTVRDRDSTAQTRVKISELPNYFKNSAKRI